MNLLLHTKTKKQIDDYLLNPSHGVGIFSPKGTGKKVIANYIAEQILNVTVTENSSHVKIVRPNEKGSVTIDDIRDIIHFTKLKTIGSNSIKRVVIIHEADHMTIEAQNALLKTLEEPSPDTIIILTSSDRNALLPTIHSRLNSLSVINPTKSSVIDELSATFDKDAIEKYWLMSNGRIGLTMSLLQSQDHPLIPYIEIAKNLLISSHYERLTQVDSLIKQDIKLLLDALYIIASAGLKQSISNSTDAQLKWHTIRTRVYESQNYLHYNPNLKILLDNLFISM